MPPRNTRYGNVQRGHSGFAGRHGVPQRGQRGFNSGPPSRTQALYEQELAEREARAEDAAKARRYIENYGQKYNDYVDNMDATAEGFEADLRTFDPRSKTIPGLVDKINNKIAERNEWVARKTAEKKSADEQRTAEQKRLKPLRDKDSAVAKANLDDDEHRRFLVAEAEGDQETLKELTDLSYTRSSETKAQKLKDNEALKESAAYDAETESASALSNNYNTQLTELDKTHKGLLAKKQAWDTFMTQEPKVRENKTADGTRPMKFDENDQAVYDEYTKQRDFLRQNKKDADNNVFIRKQKKNAKKVDAPMSRTPEDEDGKAEYDTNEFKGEQLKVNEQLSVANEQQKALLKNDFAAKTKQLEVAQQQLQQWNAKALEAPEGTPFTDEELERNTLLNNKVDELTTALMQNEEQSAELDESMQRTLKQNKQLQGEMSDYDDKRYNELLDDQGRFTNSTDEKNYDSAVLAYTRNNGMKPTDQTYDYRRAFADGVLTIGYKGELPERYKIKQGDEEQDTRTTSQKMRDSLTTQTNS